MWESRVLRRAFERLELHEGKLSRAVLRGGGGGDVTSLPDTWVGNHPGLPGPRTPQRPDRTLCKVCRCFKTTGHSKPVGHETESNRPGVSSMASPSWSAGRSPARSDPSVSSPSGG